MQNFEYYAIYKPFKVLCQFTSTDNKTNLSDLYDFSKNVYPVGRLDYESEGLLLLTNDNYLKTKLLTPSNKHQRTYFVQVEGIPNESNLSELIYGVDINIKGKISNVKANYVGVITEPRLPERNPPIRYRANVPTSWISITITEGKYHQIRKMTAKIGFPTLRLVRYAIEDINLDIIKLSEINPFSKKSIYRLLNL